MAIHTPETRRRTAMEVMSRPAIACRRESFLEEVAEVLADRKISGLPVVDDRGQPGWVA